MLRALCIMVILCALYCLTAMATMDKTMVLYFPFDDGNGKTVKDSSFYQNDGAMDGELDWVDGIAGGALQFRANGTVEVDDDDNSLDLIGPHTISYWLKWNGGTVAWSPFISKTETQAKDNYHTWVGSDHVWDYANNNNMQVHGKTPIPLDDKWIFLTVAHDGEKTCSFYIDAVLDNEEQIENFEANDAPFRIGSDGFSVGILGAGTMDELTVFNRALNENEIKTLMEQGGKAYTAVESIGKLTTTWSSVKNRF